MGICAAGPIQEIKASASCTSSPSERPGQPIHTRSNTCVALGEDPRPPMSTTARRARGSSPVHWSVFGTSLPNHRCLPGAWAGSGEGTRREAGETTLSPTLGKTQVSNPGFHLRLASSHSHFSRRCCGHVSIAQPGLRSSPGSENPSFLSHGGPSVEPPPP